MLRFVKLLRVHRIALFIALAASGCDRADVPTSSQQTEIRRPKKAPLETALLARVNGRPIAAAEADRLIREADGGLTPEAALDILVRNTLLTEEAEKRGFDRAPEILATRRDASARALIKTEAEISLTAETLPAADVRAYYDANLQKYVHDERRTVVHFLARTGKKRLSDTEALKIAEEASRAAQGAADEGEFRNRMKPFVKLLEKNAVLERLPPFEADNHRLVRPFVEAAFQLTGQGSVSAPVKTDFGRHVLYIVKVEPAEHRSIEDAEAEIRPAALPMARIRKVKNLVSELMRRNEVFVYEEALKEGGSPK